MYNHFETYRSCLLKCVLTISEWVDGRKWRRTLLYILWSLYSKCTKPWCEESNKKRMIRAAVTWLGSPAVLPLLSKQAAPIIYPSLCQAGMLWSPWLPHPIGVRQCELRPGRTVRPLGAPFTPFCLHTGRLCAPEAKRRRPRQIAVKSQRPSPVSQPRRISMSGTAKSIHHARSLRASPVSLLRPGGRRGSLFDAAVPFL